MTDANILAVTGLTPEWLHEFVQESNRVDPQPGVNAPGNPLYDDHHDALMYALAMAADDRYALPKEVHKLLLRDSSWAGLLRDSSRYVLSPHDTTAPEDVPRAMWEWNRDLYHTIDGLRTDDHTVSDQDKATAIWRLHLSLMRISPFHSHNGKAGRILMVNHALLCDLHPWIVRAEAYEDYVNEIRAGLT